MKCRRKKSLHPICCWCKGDITFTCIVKDRFICFGGPDASLNSKAYMAAEKEIGLTSYFHKDCISHYKEMIKKVEQRYLEIRQELISNLSLF